LEEDDLELDRVFDRVTVVLEGDGGARRAAKLVDERGLRRRRAESM